MENQTDNSRRIVVQAPKNMGIALILTFLFGPLGMLYSTIPGAIAMFIINLIAVFFTAGIGLILTWPIGMAWSAIAVNNYNKLLGT